MDTATAATTTTPPTILDETNDLDIESLLLQGCIKSQKETGVPAIVWMTMSKQGILLDMLRAKAIDLNAEIKDLKEENALLHKETKSACISMAVSTVCFIGMAILYFTK